MNDPMRILKADHREVEQLLGRLGESDEGPEREQLVAEVVMKLTAHMDVEESIVYPVVAEQVGGEDEEEARIEHGLVRTGLEQLQSMSTVPGFGAVVEMLKGGIKHHVEEEERELLPELKDAVSAEEWEAMGDAIAEAKERAGLPVPTESSRRSSKRSGGRRPATTSSSGPAKKSSGPAKKTGAAARKSSGPAKKTGAAAKKSSGATTGGARRRG